MQFVSAQCDGKVLQGQILEPREQRTALIRVEDDPDSVRLRREAHPTSLGCCSVEQKRAALVLIAKAALSRVSSCKNWAR